MSEAQRKIPYFILTLPRSGSTWLMTLLNGQDRVAAYEELFLPRRSSGRYTWVAGDSPERFFAYRQTMKGARPLKIWRYLDVVERSSNERRFVGFKLMLGHLREFPELLPILALRRYRMIALVRDNLFEGAVSRLALEMTGDAQSRSEAPRDRKFEIAPAAMVAEMQRRRLGLRLVRGLQAAWPASSIVVRYEDIRASQSAAIGSILRTLGSSSAPREVTSPLKRRIKKPYRELIINYEDVCEAARAAGFADALPA